MSERAREIPDTAELRRLFGNDSVLEHAAVTVDGLELRTSLCPTEGEQLGEMLALLAERRCSVLVRGGGSHSDLGNPPRSALAFLSTGRLCGVDPFDSQDGVLHVAAGTRLDELASCVNAEGWELPLDPPGDDATIGGVLASASIGPRRLGYGAPRDCVLGMETALPGGDRTRCGGRVVKNVTGYDLAKLYTGSFGSLAVIEGAWLRLKPKPESVAVCAAVLSAGDDPLSPALEAARRPTVRLAAVVTPGLAQRVAPDLAIGSRQLLLVEFAGDEPAVRRDSEWLEGMCGAQPVAADPVSALRELQGRDPGCWGLRARLATRPTRLAAACATLATGRLETIVHPGLGLVYAIAESPAGGGTEGATAAEGQDQIHAALRAVDAAAKKSSADVLLEALPTAAKNGRDVFGASGSGLRLMRELKQRFDPHAVLNPGRFAGRV